MPIFEYACVSCGREFEALVRSSTLPPRCPDCNSAELRKKLSAFTAIGAGGAAAVEGPAPCGTCGHPGGPGACQLD